MRVPVQQLPVMSVTEYNTDVYCDMPQLTED